MVEFPKEELCDECEEMKTMDEIANIKGIFTCDGAGRNLFVGRAVCFNCLKENGRATKRS